MCVKVVLHEDMSLSQPRICLIRAPSSLSGRAVFKNWLRHSPTGWLWTSFLDVLESQVFPICKWQCSWWNVYLGSVVKNPPAKQVTQSIPGSGRSPGGGHDNPLWYSCLENPKDRGDWGLQSVGSQIAHAWSPWAQRSEVFTPFLPKDLSGVCVKQWQSSWHLSLFKVELLLSEIKYRYHSGVRWSARWITWVGHMLREGHD